MKTLQKFGSLAALYLASMAAKGQPRPERD